MRPLRLYLETTVFNYYFDPEREGHGDVVKLFEAIGAGRYEGYASTLVVDELEEAPEPKRSDMLALKDNYGITVLDATTSVAYLAELYIENGVIPASKRYDSAHIALASIYGIDIVVSYNFQHINREKTRRLSTVINQQEGYNAVVICTAREVLNDE